MRKRVERIASIGIALLLMCLPKVGFSQLKTVDFNSLDSLTAKENRTVVVFIHTDWCKICHQMLHTSFKDDQVIKSLNEQFYFVKFNAETREDITYKGHTFKYKPTGNKTGVHELAEQLGTIDGKLNYPTLSVINAKNEILFQYGGLMDAKEILAVLKKLAK